MDIGFQHTRVNAWEHDCWLHGQPMSSLVRNFQTVCLRLLSQNTIDSGLKNIRNLLFKVLEAKVKVVQGTASCFTGGCPLTVSSHGSRGQGCFLGSPVRALIPFTSQRPHLYTITLGARFQHEFGLGRIHIQSIALWRGHIQSVALSSNAAAPFCFPISSVWSSCSTASPAFDVVSVLNVL